MSLITMGTHVKPSFFRRNNYHILWIKPAFFMGVGVQGKGTVKKQAFLALKVPFWGENLNTFDRFSRLYIAPFTKQAFKDPKPPGRKPLSNAPDPGTFHILLSHTCHNLGNVQRRPTALKTQGGEFQTPKLESANQPQSLASISLLDFLVTKIGQFWLRFSAHH